jgi:hypothetical protein
MPTTPMVAATTEAAPTAVRTLTLTLRSDQIRLTEPGPVVVVTGVDTEDSWFREGSLDPGRGKGCAGVRG